MWASLSNQGKAAVAIAAVLVTLLIYLALQTSPPPITFTEAPGSKPQRTEPLQIAAVSAQPPADSIPAPREVVIHVAGCVKRPGVYRLPPGSRVDDAIKAASGPAADADTESLNLAAPLIDGKQLYVPSRKETAPPPAMLKTASGRAPTSTPPRRVASEYLPDRLARKPSEAISDTNTRPTKGYLSSSGKLHSPGEGVVRINTASPASLQRLPGVGPATAQKIVDYRRNTGLFKQVEDIMMVKGIGPKKFEKMRPFLRL